MSVTGLLSVIALASVLAVGVLLGRRWGFIEGFEAGRVQGGECAKQHLQLWKAWDELDQLRAAQADEPRGRQC